MNVLDLIFIATVAFAAVRGLRRGLGREVIGLGATALLLFAGLPLAGPVGRMVLEAFWPSAMVYATPLGFLLLVAGVSLLSGAATALWRRVISALSLGWLDAVGGSLFGMAKASALSLVVVVFLSWLPWPPLERAVSESLAAGALLRTLPGVYRRVDKVMPPGWSLPTPPSKEKRRPRWPDPSSDSWQQVGDGRAA